MNFLGVPISVGEIVTLLSILGSFIYALINLRSSTIQNKEDIKELSGKVETLNGIVNKHEKEVGIISNSLVSLSVQISSLQNKLDTIINFLLDKKEK